MSKYTGELSRSGGERCPRCGGSGYLPVYEHIQGGVCFRCWGRGIIGTNPYRYWDGAYSGIWGVTKDVIAFEHRQMLIQEALSELEMILADLDKGKLKPKEAIEWLKKGIKDANITRGVWYKQLSLASKELPGIIKNLEKEIEELPVIIKNLQKQIDEYERKQSELQEETKSLEVQIDALNTEISVLNARIQAEQNALDDTLKESDLEVKLKELQNQLSVLQKRLDSTKSELKKVQQLLNNTIIECKEVQMLLENKITERENAQQLFTEIKKSTVWCAMQKSVKVNDIWYHLYFGSLKVRRIDSDNKDEPIAEFEIIDREGIPDIPILRGPDDKPVDKTKKFVVNIIDGDEIEKDMRGEVLWPAKKDVVYSLLPFKRYDSCIHPLYLYYSHASLGSFLPDSSTEFDKLEFERFIQIADIFIKSLWSNKVMGHRGK